jgi:hypothetical protein
VQTWNAALRYDSAPCGYDLLPFSVCLGVGAIVAASRFSFVVTCSSLRRPS